jgi:hypothetical protein
MLSPRIAQCQQIPLIHEVHSDDKRLLNTLDGECFDILYHFRWEDYREPAADYYNALYDFNQAPPQTATAGGDASLETTKEEARQRLLFDRATAPIAANPAAPILFQAEVAERRAQAVQRWDVAPGAVPLRLVGCKPKCFFGLLKGFIGASLMGFPAEPEQVHLLLRSNPAFARVCGLSHKGERPLGFSLPADPVLTETRAVRPDHDRDRHLGPYQALGGQDQPGHRCDPPAEGVGRRYHARPCLLQF